MHRSIVNLLSLTLISLSLATTGFGQQNPLNSVINKLNAYRSNTLQERLFVHTDQSFYLTGETLWFKSYYVDASLFRPLDVSKVAYVEIIDKDKKPVLQSKISLSKGTGSGSIFLPASLTSGNYLFRVYTNWMKNFDPENYFQQSITIINPFTKLGLKPSKEIARYDVQFFPEGGNLVDGIESKVAFRAVDSHGSGISFKGSIVTENGDTLMHFRPLKFGLGNFSFTPEIAHHYKAVIRDLHGVTTTYALPEVGPEGYVMNVKDSTADKIKITVSVRLSSTQNPTLYLLAHTRNIVSLTTMGYLHNNKAQFVVDKKDLTEGISHLTVFNDQLQPVIERLYFKSPVKKLRLEVHPDQSQYSTRRKVALDFYTHVEDKPAQANLSVSVYKADSTQHEQPSIEDYLLLTSELHGNIESPQYYLTSGEDDAKAQAIDNLLLTHGWSRVSWEKVFTPNSQIDFTPEMGGHIITGQVTDAFSGLPTKQVMTYLSTPEKNINLYISRSDEAGKIQFEMKNFYGSKQLILQTNTQQDSTHQLKVFSPFSEKFSNYQLPTFDLSESFRKNIQQRSIHMQVQNTFYHDKYNQFIMPPIDSIPFYGKPDEKYLLDDYTRFPTMEEVMREYVPGVLVRKTKGKFHFKTLDDINRAIFSDNPLVLLDGIPVFNIDKIMAFDPRKVKKLEVMTRKYYLGVLAFDGLVSYTTYHGDLANLQPDSKSLIVNYEGLQPYREFFSPRYETQQSRETKLPDTRTLLFWAPVSTTDKLGKGQVSFYTSDIPGKYAIVVQGITNQGEPVSSSTVIDVKDNSNY